MDFLGAVLITFGVLIVSSLAALLSLAIRPLRRFSLAILITPPAAAFLYFLCGWAIPNSSTVCGPDTVWGNCANARAEFLGWAIWIACSAGAMAAGYWGQKVLHNALRHWFNSATMSIFRNRPRWSRVAYYPSDSES
jgi:uncharacterized membrane protein